MVIFVKLRGGEAKSEVRIRAQFSVHSNHAKYVASIAFQKLHTFYTVPQQCRVSSLTKTRVANPPSFASYFGVP